MPGKVWLLIRYNIRQCESKKGEKIATYLNKIAMKIWRYFSYYLLIVTLLLGTIKRFFSSVFFFSQDFFASMIIIINYHMRVNLFHIWDVVCIFIGRLNCTTITHIWEHYGKRRVITYQMSIPDKGAARRNDIVLTRMMRFKALLNLSLPRRSTSITGYSVEILPVTEWLHNSKAWIDSIGK